MTSDTKEQRNSVGKTLGLVGVGAGIMLGITQLVVPPVKPPVNPFSKVVYSWQYKHTNELSEIGFTWYCKTNLMQRDWIFFTNVIGTNVMVVSLTNQGIPQLFLKMTKTYRLDMPDNQYTTLTNKL